MKTKGTLEINQDQDPNNEQTHLIFYQNLISLEPYNDPIILIQDDPFPLDLSHPKQDHDHPSIFHNDPNPQQDQSIPSLLDPSKDPIIPSCPLHDPIIYMDPLKNPSIPSYHNLITPLYPP